MATRRLETVGTLTLLMSLLKKLCIMSPWVLALGTLWDLRQNSLLLLKWFIEEVRLVLTTPLPLTLRPGLELVTVFGARIRPWPSLQELALGVAGRTSVPFI